MLARYDSFNRFETPVITLCKPGAVYDNGVITNTIGVLANTSDEELVANFNEVSEFNFVLREVGEDLDPDNLYSKAKNHQYIFVDDIGFFCITQIDETIEKDGSYKSIKAESAEIELQNKTMPGDFYQESEVDYQYQVTYEFGYLLTMLVEALPMWVIGEIDDGLIGTYRTFEDVSEDTNILSFCLTEMQDAFECIFVFDTINREINVYNQNNYLHKTSIQLSKDDIVNSIQVSSNADDIYTVLGVTGDESRTINDVNPLRTHTLYHFDYYFDVMTSGLADKVTDWESLIEDNEQDYYEYTKEWREYTWQLRDKNYEIDALNMQIEYYNTCYDNVVGVSHMPVPKSEMDTHNYSYAISGDGTDSIYTQIQRLAESMEGTSPISMDTYHSDALTVADNQATILYTPSGSAGSEIAAVYVKNSDGLFVRRLLQASSVSVGHFTYNRTTKVISFYPNDLADGTDIAVFYDTDDQSAAIDTVFVTDILTQITTNIASVRALISDIQDEIDEIQDQADYYANLRNAIYNSVNMEAYFTQDELDELQLYMFEGNYTDEYLIITDIMTQYEQVDQEKEMYDRAKNQLKKISQPTEEFTVDTENFIFQKKFEPWTDQLETGVLVAVEIGEKVIAENLIPKLYLSEFENGDLFVSNGITWKTNPDGSITATGTATAESTYDITSYMNGTAAPPLIIDPSKQYMLTGCPSNGSNSKGYIYYSMKKISELGLIFGTDIGNGVQITPNNQYNSLQIQLRIANGYTCPPEGFTFHPMLTVGNKKYDYVSKHSGSGKLCTPDIADLFLASFTVNYADATLSMTFGNRYNKFDTKSLFEDLLGNIQRTSNSVSFIKESLYPIRSGEFDAMREQLANIRTISANQAFASQNQDFVIDSTGITGVQLDRYGEPLGKQLKIVNNMIAMTKDSWDTCDIAIGELLIDGEPIYGVNAKMLMGDVIIGSQLGIHNESGTTTIDKNGITITSDQTVSADARQSFILQRKDSDQQGTYVERILYIDSEGNLQLNNGDHIYLDGKSIATADKTLQYVYNEYNINQSPTVAPTYSDPDWSETVPTWQEGYYIWSRTVTVYIDATTEKSAPYCVTGSTGQPGSNTAIVYLYKRSSYAATIDWNYNLTYNFESKALTSTPLGWYQTIPSGTDPIYVTAATAYSTNATDTIAHTEWATPVVLSQNGGKGDDGANTATVFLYQRASSEPTTKPSSTITYTFATGSLSGGYDTNTGINNWSSKMPSSNGNPCWVIQATAISTGPTDTIASTEWSGVKQYVEDGTGITNCVVYYYIGTSQPSRPTDGSQPGSGWSTTEPAFDATKNIWICWQTTYTSGISPVYSPVSLYSAYEGAKEAAKTATYYISSDESYGIRIHDNGNSDDYLQINSNALSFYRNNVEVSRFEDSLLRLGQSSEVHSEIGAGYFDILEPNGTIIAHFGYDSNMTGYSRSYYSFGTRSEPFSGAFTYDSSTYYYYGDIVKYRASSSEDYKLYICIGLDNTGYQGYTPPNNPSIWWSLGSTHGSSSLTNGHDNLAVGAYSIATGLWTRTYAMASMAEGQQTEAIGAMSHAGGVSSESRGDMSFAFGDSVKTMGECQTVFGTNNVPDRFPSTAIHQNGKKYGNYALIVGNGDVANTWTSSNAMALDWAGNLRLAGNVYVGCNANSSGGLSISSTISTTNISSIINVNSSNATITAASYVQYGKVAQFSIVWTNKNAISVPAHGNINNIEVGTIVEGKRPAVMTGAQSHGDSGASEAGMEMYSLWPTGVLQLGSCESTGAARTIAAGRTFYCLATYILP